MTSACGMQAWRSDGAYLEVTAPGAGAPMVISLLAFGALLWLTVAAVALVSRGQLTLQPSANPPIAGEVPSPRAGMSKSMGDRAPRSGVGRIS